MRKLDHDEIRWKGDGVPDPVPRPHPVAALLDNVRSIHNVGSIFRTSDAAGLEHLYLAGITGTPDNRGIRKAALGAEEIVPWSSHASSADVIDDLKSQGYTIAALEITDSPRDVSEITLQDFPLCLVVGNEVSGIGQPLLDRCDMALQIPQYGVKQSLNVAVAFGVVAFQLIARYRAAYRAQNTATVPILKS